MTARIPAAGRDALAQPHGVLGGGGSRPGRARAEVTVLVRPPDPLAPYDYSTLELHGAELQIAAWPWSHELLEELLERTRPDITCSIGQTRAIWRVLHRARRRYGTRTVMFVDNLWLGRPRQHAVRALFRVRSPLRLRLRLRAGGAEHGVCPTAGVLPRGRASRVSHGRRGAVHLGCRRQRFPVGRSKVPLLRPPGPGEGPGRVGRGLSDLPGKCRQSVAAPGGGTRSFRRWPGRGAWGDHE